MDEATIKECLSRLGCRKIKGSRRQINSTCPDESQHKRGRDNRPGFTVKVNPGGKSPCYCPSCKFSDSLEWLMWERCGDNSFLNNTKNGESLVDLNLNARIWGKPLVEKASDPSEWPEELWEPFSKGVPKYVLERGLSLETCKEWKLGHDKERKRLMFSIRNREGKFVGAAGRTIGRSQLKYANYSWDRKNNVLSIKIDDERDEDFVRYRRSFYLYGEHMLTHDTDIVLVEGQLDAPSIWQVGFNSVASLGSVLTYDQSVRLSRMCKKDQGVIIMYDADKSGVEATREAKAKLQGKVSLKIVEYPKDADEDVDPNELTPSELREMIHVAISR